MQKKLIAVAVAALASSAAMAQVTVYGVADAYFAYTKVTDHDARTSIDSGGLSGSRIGFKAVEDLGNGTSALAVIEYGFKMDDGNWAAGTDSGLAARQKLVGLTGGWGTAVAGYAQSAGYDYACAATPFAGSALDPEKNIGVGLILSCGNNGRAGNAIAYISPNFGGFTAAYNHAKLVETTSTPNGQDNPTANLLTATYAAGPVVVSGVYSKVSDQDLVALTHKSINELGLRGSFDFRVAKVFAAYQSKDTEGVDNKDTSLSVGAAIPVGAAGTVALSFQADTLKESATISGRDKKNALSAAYLHAVSKRTTAYAGFTLINDKTPASDVKTQIVAGGLRHTF